MTKNEAKNLFDIDLFLEYLQDKKYSKSTISGYYFGIKNFLSYAEKNNLDLALVNNQNILDYKNYLNESGNSNQTINSKLYAVIKYFDYLKKEGRINISISADFCKNKNKKDIINISLSDFEQILNSINNLSGENVLLRVRDELIFKTIYYTGMRTKDLLRLKRKEFNGQILNTTNGNIHINASLSAEFKSYLDILPVNDDQYLFFSFGGRKYDFNSPLTEKSIEDFFRKYTAMLDAKLSIRDLRNSHLSNLQSIPSGLAINQIHTHKIISIACSFLDYFNSNKNEL